MNRGNLQPPNTFIPFKKTEIEQSISDRFENQVARFADRMAVKTSRHAWSYGQLNEIANRIAGAVFDRCGESSEPVAFLLEQDATLVAAILGILKANKFYVPLDGAYPLARIKYMLEDSQAKLIITDRAHLALAEQLSGAQVSVLLLDESFARKGGENPGVSKCPDALAYIYYTSGSTGQPKGVMDTHRNVLHNISRYTNNLCISPEDRLTLLQSCAFSGAVSSLFCALLNGACSYPFDLRAEAPHRLAEYVRKEELTVFHSVPAIFRSFLEEGSAFPSVRVVRLEGDQAARIDAELFQKHFSPTCLLVNGLGATETGIVCQYFMNQTDPLPKDRVPIGYPSEDMEVLLLDGQASPVTPGEVGEISVRSQYLSPGYWKRPDLTQTSFLPDPQDSTRRIYRTGDLGRACPDGCLEHLGRKDFRVKVRGNTIEPAEVELALMSHPNVKEAVVATRPNRRGEPRLVAYVVGGPRPSLVASELRRHLGESLPQYMIPSSFVFLNVFPLNENKKVDRNALPAPEETPRESDTPYVGPRHELEISLKNLWEDVLDVRPIGVEDNFFDLGGDSLLAAVIFTEIQQQFGKSLPLATLVDSPTIAQLASLLRSPTGIARTALVAIESHGSQLPLYAVHGHTGEVFFYRELSQRLGSNQPFLGLQSLRLFGNSGPVTVEGMAAHYVREIFKFQPHGPYRLAGYCFGGMVAFEMAQQFRAQGEEVGLLALFDPDFPGQSFMRPLQQRITITLQKINARLWQIRSLSTGKQRREFILHKTQRLRQMIQELLHLQDAPATNTKASHLYRPQPFFGRAVLFLSKRSPAEISADPRLKWREFITGGVEVEMVPGHLHSMLKEPHVGVVAERLRRYLEKH